MAGGTDGPPHHTRLLQKLDHNVPTYRPGRSIFKVPNNLRRISRQAYEPQVISIGPYHHGKGQLKKMEAYKMLYLKKLLERSPEVSLEDYVTALKVKEKEAREFYSEPLKHISGEKFVEMMLLDGCFIIELIRKIAIEELKDGNDQKIAMEELKDGNDQKTAMEELKDGKDHFLTDFILRGIACDLLLVENQLPFSILLLLFSMTVTPNDEETAFMDIGITFMHMAIKFFSKVMPGSPRSPEHQDINHLLGLSPQHLLGLLHDSCCQPPSSDCQDVHNSCSPEKVRRSLCSKVKLKAMGFPCLSSLCKSAEEDDESKSGNEDQEIRSQCPMAKLNCCSSVVLRCSPSICTEEPDRKEWRFIRSATELSEAGINFKKTKGRLFDIKFQNGVLSIPTLMIEDDTEFLLRNLVAYEQYFSDASSKCFTNYIAFMDCLINTWKDVELLCHHGIIYNWLGDHEVVAAMFNKLCDYVLISEKDFSYAKPFKKVNKHCDRRWNKWKTNLWHNYFNTPWAGIAFFAAVFGLLLTVLQSVFSVLSYLFN